MFVLFKKVGLYENYNKNKMYELIGWVIVWLIGIWMMINWGILGFIALILMLILANVYKRGE